MEITKKYQERKEETNIENYEMNKQIKQNMEEIDIIINMSKGKKQRLREYQNNYCDSEKSYFMGLVVNAMFFAMHY